MHRQRLATMKTALLSGKEPCQLLRGVLPEGPPCDDQASLIRRLAWLAVTVAAGVLLDLRVGSHAVATRLASQAFASWSDFSTASSLRNSSGRLRPGAREPSLRL